MNPTSEYDFTIIVPVYNEEDNMEALESRFAAYLKNAPVKTSVLFVNDGSSDNSLALIREACEGNADFHYISFARNAGLSAAIKAGIDYTESPLVGYIDADLQTAPEDFDRLLKFTDDYQLVTGIRADRKDSGFKKLQSRIANGFRRKMTGDGVTDTGCPLKIMHTDYAKRVPFFTGMHRFLPALFLLQEAKIKEVPVRHFPRVAGVSKYNLRNRLIAPFIDCFAYRWMKKRYFNYQIGETDLGSAE